MNKSTDNYLYWHSASVDRKIREKLNGHKSVCLWLTGLSGSGKSTIAVEIEKMLFTKNIRTYILDGDNIRHGLNNNLGFTSEDRTENIRRVGEVSKLFVDAGLILITSFISPFKKDRNNARSLLGEGNFVEIYIKTHIKICEERDPKGLYKKARKGEVKDFTGISSPFEEPENPELVLINNKPNDVEKNIKKVLEYLTKKKIINLTD